MSEQKRVAIVTGGTRGIGAAITTTLARSGVHVAAGYHRGRRAAEELQEMLAKEDLSVSIHVGNVGEPGGLSPCGGGGARGPRPGRPSGQQRRRDRRQDGAPHERR